MSYGGDIGTTYNSGFYLITSKACYEGLTTVIGNSTSQLKQQLHPENLGFIFMKCLYIILTV